MVSKRSQIFHEDSRIRSRIIEYLVYRSSDIGPRVASYMASRYFRWERWQDFSFLTEIDGKCFFDRDLRRENIFGNLFNFLFIFFFMNDDFARLF